MMLELFYHLHQGAEKVHHEYRIDIEFSDWGGGGGGGGG